MLTYFFISLLIYVYNLSKYKYYVIIISMDSGKIVVVDDEKIVTSAFKTLFMVEGFDNAAFFNNPKEALEYIKNNTPDLIISDFLMPDMNGLEFLTEANKLYPEVSKILLTGYADKENAIKAINEVGLYRYIEKPWDNDDLIINIKNGIERSYLLSQLRQKIAELEVAHKELENYSHNLEEIVKERTADLVESNAKLSGIITNCADGIFVIDNKGKIEQTNQACETLSGLSEENLKKLNIQKFICSEKFDIVDKINESDDNEFYIRDCSILNLLSNVSTPIDISLAKTSDTHYVGVIHNISEQKESDKLRDDFIATLTHDLRTPLLAAIQTLKFFIDGSLGEISDKQRVLLSTMQKSNEDLLGLVNALLEVYRFDAQKLVLCRTNFSFNSLVTQVYNELSPLAKKKNITFKLDIPEENITINADGGEIRRVVCNLCGNAINYTNNDGEVIVSFKIEDRDLIFSVQDNGNGIPKEDIPNLFQRFSQGTSQKRSTGTGLGLYLSRQIIEAHNGKIWLESKLNKGSEFSFLLTDVVTQKNNKKIVEKI